MTPTAAVWVAKGKPRQDGTRPWCLQFRDSSGRLRQETLHGCSKRDADKMARERMRRMSMGELYETEPQTVSEAVNDWLHFQQGQVKPSTLKRRTEALRALGVVSAEEGGRPVAVAVGANSPGSSAPVLCSYLPHLTVRQLEDALDEITRRGSTDQAGKALAAFKQVLRYAQSRGQRFDPRLLEVKAPRHEAKEPVFLTWEQGELLQSWMPEYVCRIVPVAMLTGARQGELFDLRESDLDLEAGTMLIRSGKTKSSRRTVNLGQTAVRLLKEQLLARTHTEGGYVFPAPMGGRWSKDNFTSRVFRPAVKAARLDERDTPHEAGGARGVSPAEIKASTRSSSFPAGVSFHALRHSYCSMMLAAGVSVHTVAGQVGHKDGGALLLKRYAHQLEGAGKRAAVALDALVNPKADEREESA